MRIQTSASRVIALALVLGFARGAAGQDAKAAEVLAGTRKAIGKKLETLTSLSVQAATQRNLGNFQMTSDLELLIDLPDKYLRSESSNSAMVNMSSTMGFNGDRPVKGGTQEGMAPGGGMIIRMGGPGVALSGGGEKPTPEQQEQLDKQMVRTARQEISRLMLGWFAMTHPSLTVQYTYVGEAESPDGKAFIVDARNEDGFAARLFVDEKTHLPLMMTYQRPQPRIVTAGGPRGASPPPTKEEQTRLAANAKSQVEEMQKQPPVMVEYTLYFDDWRDEDGIKFPHAFRRASGGTTTEEWTINKVKVNPKIDPKKFETER
jgi:hypothetical protein